MDAQILAGATCLVVKDLRASFDWYTSCLEFASPGLDWDAKPNMCLLERGNGVLLLQEAAEKPLANRHCKPGSSLCDVYFWTDDIGRLELAIKVSGNKVYAGPTKRNYGTIELMIVDPDDYLICFGQHQS